MIDLNLSRYSLTELKDLHNRLTIEIHHQNHAKLRAQADIKAIAQSKFPLDAPPLPSDYARYAAQCGGCDRVFDRHQLDADGLCEKCRKSDPVNPFAVENNDAHI